MFDKTGNLIPSFQIFILMLKQIYIVVQILSLIKVYQDGSEEACEKWVSDAGVRCRGQMPSFLRNFIFVTSSEQR